MFPDFHYLFLKLFQLDLPFLSIIKTFGFFVAMAFLFGARVLQSELKRKTENGALHPIQEKDKKTGKLVWIYPHQRLADIIMVAVIAGFIGAKIFNAFETWQDFIADPIGNLFSTRGLTFYGGLIAATLALFFFARKKGIGFRHLCDAAAPALILAYGIGRLGCQMSGDGDWGIYNSAYVTNPVTTELQAGPINSFYQAVKTYPDNFREFSNVLPEGVPNKYFEAPAAIPQWLVAMNFPNNVNNDGIPIVGDSGDYTHVLPAAVFPTSLYEAIACILLFAFIWAVRKKFNYPLQLFGFYLILNGLERFTIEKIRVNYKYDWGFLHPTQAEIISACLVLVGIFLWINPPFIRKATPKN